ncbi:MAG: pantetheine-phosphate adenylyltransferase [Thaumarchaeota archaeon]|nr:pantetheine-phosphate adenylyltransferase [Nitrososphaerota archaeon]
MPQFKTVALGGTFDIIHRGHLELLRKAFSISSKVIIGLTSDELAIRKGKNPVNKYSRRETLLSSAILKNFPNSSYEISKLVNDFGPAAIEGEVEALVTSEETSHQGDILNDLRKQKKLPPVAVIVVPMVMAKDGKRISSTRIKNFEIDTEGNLPQIDN